MSEQKTSVRIEIYGNAYKLKSGSGVSAPYIQRIAAEVDGKMRKISENFPHLDMPRIAVLSAVNMMDDHFKLQEELEKVRMESTIKQQQSEEEMKRLSDALAHYKQENEALKGQADLHKERQQQEDIADHSKLEENYRKLQEEYEKLKSEYNEWIQLAELEQS